MPGDGCDQTNPLLILKTEKFAVVGVLLEADECGCTPNPVLQVALDNAPVEPGAKAPLAPTDVLRLVRG